MSRSDQERWDGRHRAAVAAGGTARPAPPDALRARPDLVAPVAPGSAAALDVACGTGTVARWLRGRGFAVDAVDISAVAVAAGAAADGDPDARAADAADDAAVPGAGPPVRWSVHDLDAGLPPGWVGPYAVVVCQRFHDPALAAALRSVLASGGLMVVSALSVVGDDGAGRFRAAPGELLVTYPGLEVLAHAEADGRADLVARSRGTDWDVGAGQR